MCNKLIKGSGELGNIILDILVEPLKDGLLKMLSDKVDEKKFDEFIADLNNWTESFIDSHQESVIAKGVFANTIKYYNIIDNIVQYVNNPRKQLESEFVEEKVKLILQNILPIEKVTPLDESYIKEFINKILSDVKGFYNECITKEGITLNYGINQLLGKVDKMNDILCKENRLDNKSQKVIKKKYDTSVENLIERKVAPYSDVQQGEFHLYFCKDKQERLLDVCLAKKQVVLLGDAGSGKSVVLQRVAEEVYNTEYYPLICDLRNYTCQEMYEIIGEHYPNVESDHLFLIFDAYDEIEEKNRYDFARKITQYVRKNPKTIVLISTRGNFYNLADDEGVGSTFDGFYEYGLCPLTTNEIKEFVTRNSIKYDLFMHEIQRQRLTNMTSNPFYLKELVELLKQCGELPEKNKVMEEMIKRRFKSDVKKYVITKGIQNYEYEIMSSLQKVAFAMQCMHQVELSDINYQKLICVENRELLMFSGVFNKNVLSNWVFEHNNFREYLTASYLYELDFSTLKKVICNSDGSIKKSWANVLSYYLLLNPEQNIIEWLSKTDMSIFVKSEKSRIGENERNKIFMQLFDSYTERNMWITRSTINLNEFADFSQSAKACDYLCSKIENPKHFREQCNAIYILSEFRDLHGKDLLVQNTLFNCIKSDKSRDYEKQHALEALVKLNFQNKEISDYLVSVYDKKLASCFRYGIILYLSKTSNFQEYIDIFLNEYDLCNEGWEEYHVSINCCIRDVLERANDYMVMCKIISYFSTAKKKYYDENKIFNNIISVSTEWYSKGKSELFDVFYKAILSCSRCNKDFFECCREFFSRNKLIKYAFVNVVEEFVTETDFHLILMLRELADDECYEVLLEMYLSNTIKYREVFYQMTLSMRSGDNYYLTYVETLKKDKIDIPKSNIIDYEGERKKGNQLYFDSLFDKEKFIKLTKKILDFFGDEEMTIEQLRKASAEREYRYDSISIACRSACFWLERCENKDESVKEVVKRITLAENFGISEIYHFLKNEKDIIVDENQKLMIKKCCLCMIDENENWNKITEEENHISFSWVLIYIIFFSSYFDFSYNDDIYFKMLSIPQYLFYDKYDNNQNDDFTSYLKKKLSDNQIKLWIKDNAQYGNICRDVAEMCIKYCERNNLDIVVDLAEEYCKNACSLEYTKYVAIQYLDKVKGYNYIYEKFLKTNDEILLKCIVDVTKKYRDIRLIKMLEEVNESSDDKTKFLLELISMQSKKGLQVYYELSKQKMSIIDYSSKNNILEITEAISGIKSPELMPELSQLQQLVFLPEFKDGESFGLRNSLSKAFFNIAKDNYEDVKQYINGVLRKQDILEEEKCFCNSLMEEITLQQNSVMDFAWSLAEVKNFFLKHHI